MLIKDVNGKSPKIPSDCFVAENATIVGDVSFGENCSVWFNAVIRGDVHFIAIGNTDHCISLMCIDNIFYAIMGSMFFFRIVAIICNILEIH